MTPAPNLVGTLRVGLHLGAALHRGGRRPVARAGGRGIPILAVLIGVIAALPLSWLLLRGLRVRMDALFMTVVRGAAVGAARGAAGAAARRRPPPTPSPSTAPGERAERQADPGEHRPAQQ